MSANANFRLWLRKRRPQLAVFGLVSLLLIILLWNRMIIIVHSGEAGILWDRFTGTQVDRVYGEGLKIISPLNTMAVYQIRNQLATHEMTVLSIDGLKLKLFLAIRYRPEVDLLGMLHERIGPEYLTRVVIPQTESVLRKQLGTATAEQIYTDANGLLTKAMITAMEEIGRNFVEVEDIIIRRILLPDMVRQAIEDKLVQQEVLASYEYRRKTAIEEAERKRIESTGIRDFHQIVDTSLSQRMLQYHGINAARDIAGSDNPKTLVIGRAEDAPPIILGAIPQHTPAAVDTAQAPDTSSGTSPGGEAQTTSIR